jgi:hypothetical protein
LADPGNDGNHGNANPGVIPNHARYAGKTPGEWLTVAWQWFYDTLADGPNTDSTGAHFAVGQSGPVWFLPLFVRGGDLTLPAGKALMISVGATSIFFRVPPGLSPDELRAFMESWFAVHNPAVTIDGTPLEDVQSYFTFSPVYWLDVGTSQGLDIAAGFQLLLTPLPVGQHTLSVSWDVIRPPSPIRHLTQNFTINVVAAD